MWNDWLMGTGFLLGSMKMFWNQMDVIVAQHCEYTKCHQACALKMVSLMLVSFTSI